MLYACHKIITQYHPHLITDSAHNMAIIGQIIHSQHTTLFWLHTTIYFSHKHHSLSHKKISHAVLQQISYFLFFLFLTHNPLLITKHNITKSQHTQTTQDTGSFIPVQPSSWVVEARAKVTKAGEIRESNVHWTEQICSKSTNTFPSFTDGFLFNHFSSWFLVGMYFLNLMI